VATPVSTYELEIHTGASEAEGDTEGDRRAELTLLSEQGEHLGRIYFYGSEVALNWDFVDRASRPILHLHTDMLSSVLNLLESEKPAFVELRESRGRLTTDEESVVSF